MLEEKNIQMEKGWKTPLVLTGLCCSFSEAVEGKKGIRNWKEEA